MTNGTVRRPHRDGVVVADGCGLRRELLVTGLRSAGVHVLAAVSNAAELEVVLRTSRPDAVVLDGDLPPSADGGTAAARWLAGQHPGTALLVLWAGVDVARAARLLALDDPPLGLGLLLRDEVRDLSSLVVALERVGDGDVVVEPAVVRALLRRRADDDPLDGLTPREQAVLRLVADGRSNAAVARELSMAVKTVEKCITSINQKLDLSHDEHDPDVNTRVLAVRAYLRHSEPVPVA